MKIGYDAKRLFFNFTGLGNYSRMIVLSLLKNFPEDKYYLFTPRLKNKNLFSEFIKKCRIVEPDTFMGNLFPQIWRRTGIVKDIINNELDVYHGLSHEIPAGLKKEKIKTVVTIHDLIFLRFPEFYKPWDVWNYKRRYLKSCLLADKIIAISENTRRDIVELLGVNEEKISVVYQSVNPVYYKKITTEYINTIKLKYELPEQFILSVGSLNKRKNTLKLVEALSKVKNKNLNLVIVGKGSEYGNIVRAIKKFNLKPRVIFFSNIPNEELPVFFNLSKMFAYPSFYEGMGLPIIESLLCKTPVITNKGSCFSEAGGDGAIYVDVNNPDEIAGAIDFFGDEKICREYSEKGFRYVQKFTPEEFARGVHKVYEDLLH
jgi:glycosyltransferase involved in cell wall biosynthesis